MKQREKIIVDADQIETIQQLFKIGMAREVPKLLKKEGGLQLNLGAGNGFKVLKNTIPLDYPEWDAETDPIPFSDDSVDVCHAYHFLEHVKNIKFLLSEISRVLKPGGYCNIVVPYYSSQLQHICFDHVTPFTERSFENLFEQYSYEISEYNYSLKIHFQMIIGIVERNLCLMVQLVKVDE